MMGKFQLRDGAPRPKVVEHLSVVSEATVEWKRPRVNLSELAKLRWVDKWSFKQLSKRFERSPITIRLYCRDIVLVKIRNIRFEGQYKEQILRQIDLEKNGG